MVVEHGVADVGVVGEFEVGDVRVGASCNRW